MTTPIVPVAWKCNFAAGRTCIETFIPAYFSANLSLLHWTWYILNGNSPWAYPLIKLQKNSRISFHPKTVNEFHQMQLRCTQIPSVFHKQTTLHAAGATKPPWQKGLRQPTSSFVVPCWCRTRNFFSHPLNQFAAVIIAQCVVGNLFHIFPYRPHGA